MAEEDFEPRYVPAVAPSLHEEPRYIPVSSAPPAAETGDSEPKHVPVGTPTSTPSVPAAPEAAKPGFWNTPIEEQLPEGLKAKLADLGDWWEWTKHPGDKPGPNEGVGSAWTMAKNAAPGAMKLARDIGTMGLKAPFAAAKAVGDLAKEAPAIAQGNKASDILPAVGAAGKSAYNDTTDSLIERYADAYMNRENKGDSEQAGHGAWVKNPDTGKMEKTSSSVPGAIWRASVENLPATLADLAVVKDAIVAGERAVGKGIGRAGDLAAARAAEKAMAGLPEGAKAIQAGLEATSAPNRLQGLGAGIVERAGKLDTVGERFAQKATDAVMSGTYKTGQFFKQPWLEALGAESPEARRLWIQAHSEEMSRVPVAVAADEAKIMPAFQEMPKETREAIGLSHLMGEGAPADALQTVMHDPAAWQAYEEYQKVLKAREQGMISEGLTTPKILNDRVAAQYAMAKYGDLSDASLAAARDEIKGMTHKPVYVPTAKEMHGGPTLDDILKASNRDRTAGAPFLEKYKGKLPFATDPIEYIPKVVEEWRTREGNIRFAKRLQENPNFYRAATAAEAKDVQPIATQGLSNKYFEQKAKVRAQSLYTREQVNAMGAEFYEKMKDPKFAADVAETVKQITTVIPQDTAAGRQVNRMLQMTMKRPGYIGQLYDRLISYFKTGAIKYIPHYYAGNAVGDAIFSLIANVMPWDFKMSERLKDVAPTEALRSANVNGVKASNWVDRKLQAADTATGGKLGAAFNWVNDADATGKRAFVTKGIKGAVKDMGYTGRDIEPVVKRVLGSINELADAEVARGAAHEPMAKAIVANGAAAESADKARKLVDTLERKLKQSIKNDAAAAAPPAPPAQKPAVAPPVEKEWRQAKHFTTPESAAALEAGQSYDVSRIPVHGTGGLGEGPKTNKFAGNRIYLSLDDNTWGKVLQKTGEGKVVEATIENSKVHAYRYFDYDKQKWMMNVGGYSEVPLKPVTFHISPDAKTFVIDSRQALDRAVSEASALMGKKVYPLSDPDLWNGLAKKYDIVEIRNTAKLEGSEDFFAQAKADQAIVMNKDAVSLKPPAKQVRLPYIQSTPAPTKAAPIKRGPSAETMRLKAELENAKSGLIQSDAKNVRTAAKQNATFGKAQAVEETLPQLKKDYAIARPLMDKANIFFSSNTNLGPVEQGIFRRIYPFYGFTKAMATLALKLPILAPKATALLTRLSDYLDKQSGEEDRPSSLRGYTPLGFHVKAEAPFLEYDKKGEKKTFVSGEGFNPFNVLGEDRFAGFRIPAGANVASANPVAAAAGAMAGLKTKFTSPYSQESVPARSGKAYEQNDAGEVKEVIPQEGPLGALGRLQPLLPKIERLIAPNGLGITTPEGSPHDPKLSLGTSKSPAENARAVFATIGRELGIKTKEMTPDEMSTQKELQFRAAAKAYEAEIRRLRRLEGDETISESARKKAGTEADRKQVEFEKFTELRKFARD